jgi:hypothetical protein
MPVAAAGLTGEFRSEEPDRHAVVVKALAEPNCVLSLDVGSKETLKPCNQRCSVLFREERTIWAVVVRLAALTIRTYAHTNNRLEEPLD